MRSLRLRSGRAPRRTPEPDPQAEPLPETVADDILLVLGADPGHPARLPRPRERDDRAVAVPVEEVVVEHGAVHPLQTPRQERAEPLGRPPAETAGAVREVSRTLMFMGTGCGPGHRAPESGATQVVPVSDVSSTAPVHVILRYGTPRPWNCPGRSPAGTSNSSWYGGRWRHRTAPRVVTGPSGTARPVSSRRPSEARTRHGRPGRRRPGRSPSPRSPTSARTGLPAPRGQGLAGGTDAAGRRRPSARRRLGRRWSTSSRCTDGPGCSSWPGRTAPPRRKRCPGCGRVTCCRG